MIISNNEFQDEITKLQEMAVQQAKKIPVPSRFIVENLSNSVLVIDTKTGRMSESRLYAYSEIRKVLFDLFG